MEQDLGKVLLFINLTMDPSMREQTLKEVKELQRMSKKFNTKDENDPVAKPCFGVYGQFTFDVQGGDDLTNKNIAKELMKLNLL